MTKKMVLLTLSILVLFSISWGEEYVKKGEPIALTMPGEFYMAPKWSPNGDQVAASGPSYNHIYLIEFPTGEPTELTNAASAGYGFAWSNDGAEIAARTAEYKNYRRTHKLVTYKVSDGSEETLIQSRSRISGTPRWSADDTHIYLSNTEKYEEVRTTRNSLRKATENRLLVVDGKIRSIKNADNTSKILFNDQDRVRSYAISPNGRQIVYSTSGENLWIADIDGNNRKSLGKGSHPSWSPDSEWFTFMITEDDGHNMLNSEIYIMSRDGAKKKNITNTSERIEMHPEWSPDGSWIIFDTEFSGQLFIQQIEWR